MQNPFESGHIKNYLLFYASILVIIILFFIASSLFHDVKEVEKKVFNSDINESFNKKSTKIEVKDTPHKFKLLENPY